MGRKRDEVIQLEHNVFMGIDRAAPGYGDQSVYCEIEKLSDGTLLVRSFGKLIEGECHGTQTSLTPRST